MNMIKKISLMCMCTFYLLILSGCSNKDPYPIENQQDLNSIAMISDVKYEVDESGEKSDVVTYAITDKKIMSLTFQGMGDEESLTKLLDELDKFNIKGTFFVSGVKVAENPNLANMIVNRGHEIGNATLSGVDLTTVDYTKKVVEIKRSHEEIKKYTGLDTQYVRPGRASVDDEVRLAAKLAGYDYIVNYNINPQDWDGKSAEEVAEYIFDNKKRGAIIELNLDKNPQVYQSIELIVNSLSEKSFEIVPLKDMMDIYKTMEENRYILADNWYEQYEKNSGQYNIINNGPRNEKKVALTFDDWASDDTVDSILDTLDKYNVKATFFLRAKGVEANPNLAYAISKRGHEIASHTYSHTDLDTMTPEEIKLDAIKAHEVITSAINKEPKRYLRPPRGVITEEAAIALSECGYGDIIMYGPSALDWDNTRSAEYISNYMINNIYSGEIALLHILDDINTPEALPSIIERLQAKGYEFVTVGELIN